MGIGSTIRQTKRYQEIVTVLIKYGMGDFIRASNITKSLPFLSGLIPHKNNRPIDEYTRWEDIRMALEELGPTFVKLGQMLSNRVDIIPKELAAELSRLQDTVEEFPGDEAGAILEEELKKPISELFRSFDKEPIAAASIGQVHKAVMFDGTVVAVKIQRPNIEKTINVDLEILHSIAYHAENNIESLQYFNAKGVVEEFDKSIHLEINYENERQNLERFTRTMRHERGLYIPKSYKSHSTKKVFTMEFIDGVKVSDIPKKKLEGYDKTIIAAHGAELMLKQIFSYGFFHADPHPGNIVILENNDICFLDFGMMGSIIPHQRELLESLLVAIARKDSDMIARCVLHITNSPNHPKKDEIEFAVYELVERYLYMQLDELNIAEVLNKLIELIVNFQLKVPANLVKVIRALIMIEGIGKLLEPEFQINPLIKKSVNHILLQRVNPAGVAKRISSIINNYSNFVHEMPEDIRLLMKKLQKGEFSIEFNHSGLEPLNKTISSAAYMLVIGLIVAALIVGSSIMVYSDIAPKWNGIPVIGLIGFILGGLLGVFVLFKAVKETFRKEK